MATVRQTDPPFDETEIDYAIAYTLSNILVPKNGSYLLDHDFAFHSRDGRIERFTLNLQGDSGAHRAAKKDGSSQRVLPPAAEQTRARSERRLVPIFDCLWPWNRGRSLVQSLWRENHVPGFRYHDCRILEFGGFICTGVDWRGRRLWRGWRQRVLGGRGRDVGFGYRIPQFGLRRQCGRGREFGRRWWRRLVNYPPIAPNTKPDGSDNPEGRAKNRRVEIIVIHP